MEYSYQLKLETELPNGEGNTWDLYFLREIPSPPISTTHKR